MAIFIRVQITSYIEAVMYQNPHHIVIDLTVLTYKQRIQGTELFITVTERQVQKWRLNESIMIAVFNTFLVEPYVDLKILTLMQK